MGLFRKSLVVISALAGLVIFSQAPEFSQQYRQRLGGAVEELRTVTESFDRDADAANLTRGAALLSMRESNDSFSRDRSASMETTITRFEVLRGQHFAMERAPTILRPVNAAASPDLKIVQDAWNDFEPAVPLNPPGITWALTGALLSGSLMALLLRLFFRRRKREPLYADDALYQQNLEPQRREPKF